MHAIVKRISLASLLVAAIAAFFIYWRPMPVGATVPGNNTLLLQGSPFDYDMTRGLISGDGGVVVFNTRDASNTNNPQNLKMGLIKLNLASGQMSQVDVSTDGIQSDASQGGAVPEAISETGRYVAFMAYGATNLIDGETVTDPTGGHQAYLRDTKLGTTILLASINGVVPNRGVTAIGVSEDGRFVLLDSPATNLSSDATTGASHLYLEDLNDNTLTLLDRTSTGAVQTGNVAPGGAMSCDGSLIVFQSSAQLIPTDTNVGTKLYLLDLRNGEHRLTDITGSADAYTIAPTISCNGDYIGFISAADNLDMSTPVAANTQNSPLYARPYVYDRIDGRYYLIATTASGVSTNANECSNQTNGITPCMAISDTGVSVMQTLSTSQLGYGANQLVLHNIKTGTTELLSKNSDGIAGNGVSNNYSITNDGSRVLYTSSANNLIVGQTVSASWIYLATTGL